jgi:hypothetical protein
MALTGHGFFYCQLLQIPDHKAIIRTENRAVYISVNNQVVLYNHLLYLEKTA